MFLKYIIKMLENNKKIKNNNKIIVWLNLKYIESRSNLKKL